MKKSEKKKYDNVVISKEELIPTTIGVIREKESSPLGVIILFVLLITAVIFMPDITRYINEFLHPVTVNEESTTGNNIVINKEEDKNPNVNEKDIEYLNAKENIEMTIQGMRIGVTINENTKEMNLVLTNISGSSQFFINNKYYIELYSSDKKLLSRIKIPSKALLDAENYVYDISSAYRLGDVAYALIEAKEENDYPGIELINVDDYNRPYLTCKKDNTSIVYTFNKDNNSYKLIKIKESSKYVNPSETIINEYERKIDKYETIKGVNASITPATNGFTFNLELDLNYVKVAANKTLLDKEEYYESATSANKINFELTSLDYTCN